MRYFLIGYYGFGNDGDEWLKRSTIRLIRAQDPHALIGVLSGPLGDQEKSAGVYEIPRRSLIWQLPNLIRADLWVWGGGSVFQDFSSRGSFYYYLIVLCIGKLFRKEQRLIGHGFSKMKHPFHERLLRYCLNDSSIQVSVRDQESGYFLSQKPRYQGADLSFISDPELGDSRGESGILGVCLRHVSVPLFGAIQAALADYECCYYLSDYQLDYALLESPYQLDARPIQSLTQDSRVLVSMRYHACILAAMKGIPFVAIGDEDPKLKQLANQLGQRFVQVNEDIRSAVQDVWDHDQAYRDVLIENRLLCQKTAWGHQRLLLNTSTHTLNCLTMFLGTMDTLIDQLRAQLGNGSFKILCTLNPIIWETFKKHPSGYFDHVNLYVVDGKGIEWAMGDRKVTRIPGIHLVEHILYQTDLTVYVVGATDSCIQEWRDSFVKKMGESRLKGVSHGYLNHEQQVQVIQDIVAKKPDIVLVGMGAPKQELFLLALQNQASDGWGIGVGGTFDVLSGQLKRAPKWAQTWSLEWLYRGLQSPKRLKSWWILIVFVLSQIIQSLTLKTEPQ